MNIGEPLRALYIEPIEELPPAEVSVPAERLPDPLPDPKAELEPA